VSLCAGWQDVLRERPSASRAASLVSRWLVLSGHVSSVFLEWGLQARTRKEVALQDETRVEQLLSCWNSCSSWQRHGRSKKDSWVKFGTSEAPTLLTCGEMRRCSDHGDAG
jgi:hypothetical protein